MAGVGWIDFSPDHRDKVATVIDLLRPEGQVDELGIGIIRNSLSDTLFPGTSTIQTRAKYFLIVPRILKEFQKTYENRKTKPPLKEYLRRRENQIIRFLADKYKDAGEQGVFGITLAGKAAGMELARKPSSVYWTGLRSFKIIRTARSLNEYMAKHDSQESIIDLMEMVGDEKGDDLDAGYEDTFGISLPDGNVDWDKDLSIDLTAEEAGFLKDKIIDNHRDKMIGQVLQDKALMGLFVRAKSFRDMCDVLMAQKIPAKTKTYLKLAKDFDEIIHGAHIRYNCLLQKKFGTDVLLKKFSEEWDQWWQGISANGGVLIDFDENYLIEMASTLRSFTRDFVRNWVDGLRRSESIEYFDELVEGQEKRNKGRKARLRQTPGEAKTINERIGINGLTYRYPVVRTIVNDIKRALAGNHLYAGS